MRRLLALSLFGLVGTLAGACSSMTTSPTGPSATDASVSAGTTEAVASVSANLAFCADEINRYRSGIGQPALARSQHLEAYASVAAQTDTAVRVAHHYFRETNGGGVSHAETEILWWKGQAVRDVVQKGLAQMWRVGPGGAHYDIMAGSYTEVGCGIFISGDEVTIAQEFR